MHVYPIALGQTESAWNALTLHWPLGVRFSVSFIPHEQLLLVSYPPSTTTTIPTITTTETILVTPLHCLAWGLGSGQPTKHDLLLSLPMEHPPEVGRVCGRRYAIWAQTKGGPSLAIWTGNFSKTK